MSRRLTTPLTAAIAVAAVLTFAACGSTDDPGDGPTATGIPPSTVPAPTPSEVSPNPSDAAPPSPAPTGSQLPTRPGAGGEQLPTDAPEVADAVADLAEHLGVDPGDVSVLSYEAVTWRDGSIGCPRPGMNYTQALVPGARLLLAVDGTEYAYHAGREPELTRCDDPQAPAP